MEQYTINKEQLEAVMYGYASYIAAYDTKAISALEWFKKYGPRTPSPAKAEQERPKWVNFSEFKFNAPDVFTLRRIGDKRSTVSLFIDETTDIADLIRRQFGSITYSVQLEYLSESTTPPGYEALQPPFPRSVDDRIIARRNLYMSLEQAVYQKGYDEGKRSVATGLRWVKASDDVPPELPHVKLVHIQYMVGNTLFKTTGYYMKGNWFRQNDKRLDDVAAIEWLDESDSPAPVQVDPVAFAEWTTKGLWITYEGLWYKNRFDENPLTRDQLLEKYTQSLQP